MSSLEEFEPDIKPKTKEEIAKYSYQYQREWRFEREKRLMEHALTLFPEWDYVHKRLEWHTRPIFHRDPSKSKTQPRKPLHLPRDLQYIPKQETISNMCFVTASGSDYPYFELSVQLLESIKATRWYNHVPIKVLDCGLTQEDKFYLQQRFGCEVKDPGWDVDPSIVQFDSNKDSHVKHREAPKNGWKGCTARPYMRKHFPGYKYYFWMDTDTWVQDESAIAHILYHTEKQGLCATKDFNGAVWNSQRSNFGSHSIPASYLEILINKTSLLNSIYCITDELSKRFETLCDAAIEEQGVYIWGFDMAILSYLFYREIENGYVPHMQNLHYIEMIREGVLIDHNQRLYTINNQMLGIICLNAGTKIYPYYIMLANSDLHQNLKAIAISLELKNIESKISEEEMHQTKLLNNWRMGNYFYRVYPFNPEDTYGPIYKILN